jgi:aryl-phospho-beta-D-glucosidase BglC (GH1 family)
MLHCSKDSITEPDENPITFEAPQEVLGKMMRGINIGNTLEPPIEGEWNNGPLREYYFDDYKRAGFSCVRIPIRWDKHTEEVPPYTIHSSWLNRVEQVVDWGLARDLYIIINAHHDWWLVNNYSDPNVRARFESIWRQISERFKNKSGKLLFEMINEPHGLTQAQINELNETILGMIRLSNPKRIVIYSGHEWSSSDQLMSAAVPDDQYIMGYFHSYDPWYFAGQAGGTWGTSEDINAIKTKFETVADWSLANNIPVMISEFGAVRECNYNSRMLHYYTYVEQAIKNNIAFQAWDDGGQFGIYERDNRSWSEVKDILMNTYPEGPELLQASAHPNLTVKLTWQNRSGDNNRIIIERKTMTSQFTEIAQLTADAAEYTDITPQSNIYFYRVIYNFSNKPDMYSNPVKIFVP